MEFFVLSDFQIFWPEHDYIYWEDLIPRRWFRSNCFNVVAGNLIVRLCLARCSVFLGFHIPLSKHGLHSAVQGVFGGNANVDVHRQTRPQFWLNWDIWEKVFLSNESTKATAAASVCGCTPLKWSVLLPSLCVHIRFQSSCVKLPRSGCKE